MVNFKGKYIDTVRNIGVKLPLCVMSEVWVLTSYPLKANFQNLKSGGEEKGKENR